ncbi:hypothetical protein DM01DRAFT_328111 [Hesseltinella vesiculosa]|uniref:Uncharacterized protein n=1 Tax=Hesseltinella vesiculosa TaxID=101127 RepID=A0A1X2GWN5_9FUNG|nr:hypothetical protein DM01DRAFT_328111 [Hesseltinella vesiculosa]
MALLAPGMFARPAADSTAWLIARDAAATTPDPTTPAADSLANTSASPFTAEVFFALAVLVPGLMATPSIEDLLQPPFFEPTNEDLTVFPSLDPSNEDLTMRQELAPVNIVCLGIPPLVEIFVASNCTVQDDGQLHCECAEIPIV